MPNGKSVLRLIQLFMSEVSITYHQTLDLQLQRLSAHSSIVDDIRGLRAVAIGAVLIYHARRDWLPIGYLGVDM